jgi:hypothetical protein
VRCDRSCHSMISALFARKARTIHISEDNKKPRALRGFSLIPFLVVLR